MFSQISTIICTNPPNLWLIKIKKRSKKLKRLYMRFFLRQNDK